MNILPDAKIFSKTGESSTRNRQEKDRDLRLKVVCETIPSMLQTAVDEFIRTPKGSDAAVQEASKIELALTHGSDPNLPGSPMFSHLSKAIIHDRPWLFQKLLKHPIDVDQSVGIGQPPLHYAIQKGNAAAFQALLKRNAAVSRESLWLAAQCGQPDMVKALFARMPADGVLREDRLLEGIARRQRKQIQSMRRMSAEVRKRELWDALDQNNLSISSHKRLAKLAEAIQAGVDPNTPFKIDNRPHELNRRPPYRGFPYGDLGYRFPNPSGPFMHGNRPLHIVTHYDRPGGPELIRHLLNRGADPNSRNTRGDTPLLTAAEKGNLPALQILLRAGADPKLANNQGITPLHYAASKRNEESIRALLEAKADPNATDQNQKTPVDYIHMWGNSSDDALINLLKEYGATYTE